MKELISGIKMYKKANQVITEHKLWHYMIIPGIISLAYILMLIWVGKTYFPDIINAANELIPDFMKGKVLSAITNMLLWALLILMGYISYKYVVLILLSPILSYLSELIETLVYNQPSVPWNFKNFIKDIIRGIVINLRNLFLTLTLSFLAWLLGFTPLLGPLISGILIFMIQFYYDGFGLTDYTLERKRYSIGESIRFVRRNRGRVMGVGMGFTLMMIIPVIGWMTAPTYGTVAATLAALEKIYEQ